MAANVSISYWQLVCLATLLKVPENDSFDPYQVYLLHFIGHAKIHFDSNLVSSNLSCCFHFQELMKVFIGFIDVAGLYFALTQLTHRNISQNHKFQAVGLGKYRVVSEI